MKRYITVMVVVFFAHCGIYLSGMLQDDKTAHMITIMSSGDDAIVDAIKQHSDITEADENRWGFSWIPVVGSTIRGKMVTKVRNFIEVCRGSVIAKNWPDHAEALRDLFRVHETIQICRALDNLDKQGEGARALLGSFANNAEKNTYQDELTEFIGNIKTNKKLMQTRCSRVEQEESAKEAKELGAQRSQLEYNKLWWRTNQLRWKMAKDISTQVYKGVQWIAQTATENSAPLLSAAAMWFVYDKMFGIRRPAGK